MIEPLKDAIATIEDYAQRQAPIYSLPEQRGYLVAGTNDPASIETAEAIKTVKSLLSFEQDKPGDVSFFVPFENDGTDFVGLRYTVRFLSLQSGRKYLQVVRYIHRQPESPFIDPENIATVKTVEPTPPEVIETPVDANPMTKEQRESIEQKTIAAIAERKAPTTPPDAPQSTQESQHPNTSKKPKERNDGGRLTKTTPIFGTLPKIKKPVDVQTAFL